MARPRKNISDDDRQLIWCLHMEGLGVRRIAQRLSEERGAYKASIGNGKEFRRRRVGKDTVAKELARLKTQASKNPTGLPNVMVCLENSDLFDARLSDRKTGVS